jgi:uncharacterized protein (DUF952 family)
MRTIKEEIRDEITYQCDGPVSEFGAMYRALNLKEVTKYSTQDIADVLWEVIADIRENGPIPSNEGY